MNEVYTLFKRLLNTQVGEGSYAAESIPFARQHKIGVSSEGYPMFFIQTSNKDKALDITLEFIKVLFNRTCRLIENNEVQEMEGYTIVSMSDDNVDYQKYFIDVVCILLQELPEDVTVKTLKTELMKIASLFSSLTKPAKRTLQGLWAELFIIEQSKYPDYLIQAWHASPNDKFDFNDGRDKIEVKSTSKVRRVHEFAFEQLNPNINSNLLVASVFVIESGHGKTIFDLKDSIYKKVTSLPLQYRLNEVLAQTLGNDFDKVGDMSFDYQQALDTLQFYDFTDIPCIDVKNIPHELTNIHFDCDLTSVQSIKDKDFDTSASPLFRSIQK